MYMHFNKEIRIKLAALLKAELSQRDCAKQLGFDHSTISREISKNKDPDGVYRGASAHKRALARRKQSKQASRKIQNDPKLKQRILYRLVNKHWSPEQIAGRLSKSNKDYSICHETIYRWIYQDRSDLKKYLRCKKGKYRRKRGTKTREKQREQAKVKHIETRPAIVETRSRIGDWEGDTVVGKEKTQRILTHNERRSGYLVASKLNKVSAEIVRNKIKKVFNKIPRSKKYTITYDNGTEFGKDDDIIERDTGTDVYRAKTYCSTDRASNENLNGLLREFFPKGSYFKDVTQKDVDRAVKLINHRPRKRLNYLTPHEVFVKRMWCTSR